MRINAKDTIAGMPILAARDMLKKARNLSTLTEENLAHICKMDTASARALLEELSRRGRIAHHPDGNGWQITDEGVRFTCAKATGSLTRADAEKHYAAFMQRVRETRTRDDLFHRVSCVVLYGSFLGEAPSVNDIDLFVQITPKIRNRKRRVTEIMQLPIKSESRLLNYLTLFGDTLIAYDLNARDETFLFLKSRSQ